MKAYTLKFSLLFFLLLASLSVHAQRRGGMISGRIISTEKETVDFATVYLKGTSYGGTTNQEGLYHIKAPAGDYTLVVSAVGYTKVEKKVKLAGDERMKLNITIAPETQQLDEVTIVSTGSEPGEEVGIQCCGSRYKGTPEHHEESERCLDQGSGHETP